MIEVLKQIADQLNTKADWAIVGGAALVGAGVDLFLFNIGVLSPGECATAAAGSALAAKKGWEAHRDMKRNEKIVKLYIYQAKKLADELEAKQKKSFAEALRTAARVAEIDRNSVALKTAIDTARAQQ